MQLFFFFSISPSLRTRLTLRCYSYLRYSPLALHFLSHGGSLVTSSTFNLGICFSEALDKHGPLPPQTKGTQISHYLKAKIGHLKTQTLEMY